MEYLMVRTYDHAGYHETRLILMLVALGFALYRFYYRSDRRFLIIFASGAALMSFSEYMMQILALRGTGYYFTLLGMRFSGWVGPAIQGLLDGGACATIAFWFADLRSAGAERREWLPYWLVAALLLALSLAAGFLTRGHEITSSRQMFSTPLVFYGTTIIFISLLIAWRKDMVTDLTNFFGGLLIFTLLSLEPLHLLGARFIGSAGENGIGHASPPLDFMLMLLSHVYENGGARLHYFMFPALLGLIGLREKKASESGEKYSTQHLLDLAQRGWRRRSKPFQKDQSQ